MDDLLTDSKRQKTRLTKISESADSFPDANLGNKSLARQERSIVTPFLQISYASEYPEISAQKVRFHYFASQKLILWYGFYVLHNVLFVFFVYFFLHIVFLFVYLVVRIS